MAKLYLKVNLKMVKGIKVYHENLIDSGKKYFMVNIKKGINFMDKNIIFQVLQEEKTEKQYLKENLKKIKNIKGKNIIKMVN